MFIHLGEDIVIRSNDIVAILDKQLIQSNSDIKDFFEGQKDQENVIEISEGNLKSVVITTGKVYFSPFSSLTLKKRIQIVSELEFYGE